MDEELPENYLWMHDNAPPHIAMKTKAYLERKQITSLEWPPMLPDLNPIENVWSLLQKEVYKDQRVFKNTTDLWEAITTAWHVLPAETFQNLYNSMPGRMIKVIEEKGERIKF